MKTIKIAEIRHEYASPILWIARTSKSLNLQMAEKYRLNQNLILIGQKLQLVAFLFNNESDLNNFRYKLIDNDNYIFVSQLQENGTFLVSFHAELTT